MWWKFKMKKSFSSVWIESISYVLTWIEFKQPMAQLSDNPSKYTHYIDYSHPSWIILSCYETGGS